LTPAAWLAGAVADAVAGCFLLMAGEEEDEHEFVRGIAVTEELLEGMEGRRE